MAEKHSSIYERLSENEKNIADAIISFLDGQNTRSIEIILLALSEEIKYQSKIHS
jgi:hypothetical protein